MPRRLRLILFLLLLSLPGLWWALSATSGEPSVPAAPEAHAPPVTSAAPSPPPPETAQAPQEQPEEDEGPDEEEEEDTPDEEEGTGPCIAVEVTAHGVPVAGAHVAASRREDEHSFYGLEPLELGPDGRGQSWCVPGTYLLAAQAPGFGPTMLQIVEPETGTPPLARFELQPGHTVSGRVLDKDSQEPIPQAQVTLNPAEGFALPDADTVLEEQTATSDTHGVFRFEHLAEGTYGLSIEAPGHSWKETQVRVPRVEPLSIELVGTCRLEGEVVTAAGAPVPGATVWVSGSHISDDEKPPRTDARGHFSVEVEEGTYSLGAKAAGQVGVYEGAVTVARGGLVDGLVIRLGDSGSLSGKVFQRSSHAPVENAILSVRHQGSGWNHSARTGTSGSFHLEQLPPGLYTLTLLKQGLPQLHREGLSIQTGQELTVELPVELHASIEGSMTDSLGHPATNASVSATLLAELHPEDTPLNMDPPHRHKGSDWASADDEGQYLLSELRPGRYQLEARWSPDSKWLMQEITLQEGETAHVDFTFTETPGKVSGTVQRDSGGPPRYAVTVTATSDNATEYVNVDPDEQGRFTLNLLPGRYRLKASYVDTDDSGPEQPVTLEAGQVTEARLSVPDSVTETTGLVLNSRGEPAASASVKLEGDGLSAREETDAQGHFTLKSSRESAGTLGNLHVESDAEEGEALGVHLGSSGLVVRLMKAAALRGRVVHTRDAPVHGFELQVLRKQGNSTDYVRNETPFAGDTFEFVDLPTGTLELRVVTHDGSSGLATVRLEPGETGNVEIPVGELGRVTGRLVTRTGTPRRGWVRVDSGTPHERDGFASDDGRFEVIAIEPGPHVLDSSQFAKRPFTLRAGETLELGDLSTTPAPSSP